MSVLSPDAAWGGARHVHGRGTAFAARWHGAVRDLIRPAALFAFFAVLFNFVDAYSDGLHGLPLLAGALQAPLMAVVLLVGLLAMIDASPVPASARPLALVAIAMFATAAALFTHAFVMIASGMWPAAPWSAGVVTWANLGIQFTMCAAALFVHEAWRAARRRAAAWRELRRARFAVLRRTTEARLAALQARADPQFLFDALAAVDALHDVDMAAGAALLDDLIAYLRAALPDVHAAGSTLGRELRVAQAWLAIQRVLLKGRVAYRLDVPLALHAAAVPPMTMVPLLQAVLAPAAAAGDKVALNLSAHAVDAALEIRVHSSRGIGDRETRLAVATLRERLVALHGDAAQLRTDDCTLMLEIHHADAEGGDR